MFILTTNESENRRGVTKGLSLSVITSKNLAWHKFLELRDYKLAEMMRAKMKEMMGLEVEIIDIEELVYVRLLGTTVFNQPFAMTRDKKLLSFRHMPEAITKLGTDFVVLTDVYCEDESVEIWYKNGGWTTMCMNAPDRQYIEEFWRNCQKIAEFDHNWLDD